MYLVLFLYVYILHSAGCKSQLSPIGKKDLSSSSVKRTLAFSDPPPTCAGDNSQALPTGPSPEPTTGPSPLDVSASRGPKPSVLEVHNPLPLLSAVDDIAGLSGQPIRCRGEENSLVECMNGSTEDSLGSSTNSQPHIKLETPAAFWLDDANVPTPRASSEVELTSPSSAADVAVTETTARPVAASAGHSSPLSLTAAAAGMQTQMQQSRDEQVARVSSIEQLAALLHSTGVEPLSSTPASDSRSPLSGGLPRGAAIAGPLEGEGEGDGEGLVFAEVGGPSSEFDRGSVTSLSSLPEGTFLGEARHKDGSLLSIIFQVMLYMHA